MGRPSTDQAVVVLVVAWPGRGSELRDEVALGREV
jgi:hypothetical protein